MKQIRELIFGKTHKRKSLEEYKEEMVDKLAQEQFKKLGELGLSLPVALL
jgi:hypothetical protein